VRGMLSSSSSLRLAVTDIRSLISRRAGGAHALDVAAISRFGATDEDGFRRISDRDGRWIRAGLVRHQNDHQKSGGNLQRGLMLVILLVPGFFCKIPGMYCASFIIQSLFRKK
jgi:hypothetical protein